MRVSLYDRTRTGYLAALGALPLRARREYLFWRAHGRRPNLNNPDTFSEKITWRILFDHRDTLRWTCDKAAMKEKVVLQSNSVEPVPLLWFGENITGIDQVQLPDEWVLKPNRQSGGKVYFGQGQPNLEELRLITDEWGRDEARHIEWMGEWAYSQARSGFVVEPRVPGPTSDEPPIDYKVFTFNGTPRLVQVHQGRGRTLRQFHMYPDWTPAPISTKLSAELSEAIPAPKHLDAMLEQSADVGSQFDFMRIDFYDTGSKLLFGEVTPYPASGLRAYAPSEADLMLGRMWTLPDTTLSGR